MRNSNAILIRTLALTLKKEILPELHSESAKQAGRMALSVLAMMLARETGLRSIIEETQEKMRALCERMQAVIERNPITPGFAPTEHLLPFLETDAYDAGHASLIRTQDLLCRAAARLVAIRSAGANADDGREIDRLLHQMGSDELALTDRFLSNLDATLASVAEVESEAITREILERYLRERFPERPHLTVSNMAGAGFSMCKKILFFDMQDSSQKVEKLVIRQERPVRFMEGDCALVRNEYQLIKCAFDLGLPAPEPLWLETGGQLGADFMVMRKLPGAQIGEPFKAFHPLGEALIMQIAEILAKLHGAGLEPFGSFLEFTGQRPLLDMDIREATLFRIKAWERGFDIPNQFPNTGKAWLFDWLKKNVPENRNRPVLVHGDFNIHNMLAVGDDITACLDWEWGHPGDPLEDLNNVRIHVEKYSNWERFIQHYTAHGGPEIVFDDRVLSYHRCLTNGIYAAASSRSAWNIANGKVSDLASVFGANSYAFEFHRFALEASLREHETAMN